VTSSASSSTAVSSALLPGWFVADGLMTGALPVAACGWSGVARPTWLAGSVVAGQVGALAVLPTEHVETPDVIRHVH